MKKVYYVFLSVALLFSSCVKKKDEVVGTAHVKFVNAVVNSSTQDVYINNSNVNAGNFIFATQTNYYQYLSGINLIDIVDHASGITNAYENYGSSPGDYATVFFFANKSNVLTIGGIVDDMTAPPTGKARVRFVNLDYNITNEINIKLAGSDALFSDPAFGSASVYYNVDPGTKFQASATGVTTAPVIDFGLEAGKIYTIWLSGPSATEITAHGILQSVN